MNFEAEELTRQARILFEKYDSNGNNFIEINELKNLLDDTSKEIGIPFPSDEDVVKVMIDTDSNHDKKLGLEEFIKLYKILYLMKTESLK